MKLTSTKKITLEEAIALLVEAENDKDLVEAHIDAAQKKWDGLHQEEQGGYVLRSSGLKVA